MKQILIFVLLVCACASRLSAQNLTTVTASNIQKAGAPLASGTLCFTATDASDAPIGFRIGGGGQEVVAPYCIAITNGAIGSFQVANPANTSPANISYRVEVFDQYARVLKYSGVQFTGATFNFDNYVPSANLPLGTSTNVLSVGSLTITGSCTGCGVGGDGSGYATIQNAASSLAQRTTVNFFTGITCADNSGSARTDCQIDQGFSPTWSGAHVFNGSVNLAGGLKINGAAAQGKIPIGDGANFVPGDPQIQGLFADASTSVANPVAIGGYDTAGTPALHRAVALNGSPAGTEYGIVTRPIPGGTQTVAGTVTANAGTGTFNIQANASVNQTQLAGTAIDVNSGNKSAGTQRVVLATDQPQLTNALKVDGSAVTQPISGTVTANVGTTNGLALDATLTGGSLKAQGSVASAATDSGNPVKVGGVFNTAQPTVTTGQRVDAQFSNRGEQLIAKGVSGFSIDNTGFNVNNTPAVTQSGIWTVQPGNTANTTPWLTADSTDGNTGSAVPAKAGYIGGIGSGSTGGNLTGFAVGDSYKAINVSTATTTLLVTGVASRQVRITALHLIAAGADSVAIIEGTGATCGTGTTGMAGGTTAASGYNLAANGGLAFGSGLGTIMQTLTAGDSVCVVTSAAVQISGGLQYTIY